jgi:hypothetical protein
VLLREAGDLVKNCVLYFSSMTMSAPSPSWRQLEVPHLDLGLGARYTPAGVASARNEIGQLEAIVVLRTALNFFLQQEFEKAAARGTVTSQLPGPAASS